MYSGSVDATSIRHVRMVTDYLELSTHALPKQKLLSGMGLDVHRRHSIERDVEVHPPVKCEGPPVVCSGDLVRLLKLALPQSNYCGDMPEQLSTHDSYVGSGVFNTSGGYPFYLDISILLLAASTLDTLQSRPPSPMREDSHAAGLDKLAMGQRYCSSVLVGRVPPLLRLVDSPHDQLSVILCYWC